MQNQREIDRNLKAKIIAILQLKFAEFEAGEITHQELYDGIRFESIAATFGVSKRTFNRMLFDNKTTMTELLEKVRRELSKKHIRDSSKSIADIAQLLGYKDKSGYLYLFRRIHGFAPQDYRNLHGIKRPYFD